MYREEIELNGKTYVITLTRHAKREIERIQNKMREKLMKDDAMIELMASYGEVADMQAEYEALSSMDLENDPEARERVAELTNKMSKIMAKMSIANEIQEDIDSYEILYILISSYRKNPSITKDAFEKGLDKLEEEMGLDELETFVEEVRQKVFTEVEMLRERKEHLSKKTN